MQTVGAFIVSLFLASNFASAVPTPSGSFSAEVIPNPTYKANGALALAKAYRKYGKAIPQNLIDAIERSGRRISRDTGSAITAPEEDDIAYVTPVQIGTPPQTLNLDFDTGSSDLWVFSSETDASEVRGQALYDISKSSTAKQIPGATWDITYGDQSSSSGDVYLDTVSVGGLTVQNQAVESAKQVSDQFSRDAKSSGLLGLAFSSINTVSPNQQKTFFDNAIPHLDAPVFTADLKYHANGKYNFGFIDTKAYTGDINYVPVDNSQGFWEFNANGISSNGTAISNSLIDGIADTGTTLLLLPDNIVDAYYRRVRGARFDDSEGGYLFPKNTVLPDLTFGVGKGHITIPGKVLAYSDVDSRTTYGGLQSSSGIGLNIFGDIALKAAFVVFDGGKNQLGWASKQ